MIRAMGVPVFQIPHVNLMSILVEKMAHRLHRRRGISLG